MPLPAYLQSTQAQESTHQQLLEQQGRAAALQVQLSEQQAASSAGQQHAAATLADAERRWAVQVDALKEQVGVQEQQCARPMHTCCLFWQLQYMWYQHSIQTRSAMHYQATLPVCASWDFRGRCTQRQESACTPSSQVQQQELQLKQERAAHEEKLGQVQEEAQQQLRQVQQQLRAEVVEASSSCAMLEDQVERLAQDKQGRQVCMVLQHVYHGRHCTVALVLWTRSICSATCACQTHEQSSLVSMTRQHQLTIAHEPMPQLWSWSCRNCGRRLRRTSRWFWSSQMPWSPRRRQQRPWQTHCSSSSSRHHWS